MHQQIPSVASDDSQSIAGLSIGAVSDPPLARLRRAARVRHSRRLRAHVLQNARATARSKSIGCTREDCAGFAADAYARVNGMGAVCVTYCVGGLSLCNSIAGAYAEKSPVVVISGAPGLGERINNPLLHHKVRDFHTQADVFEKICVAGAELDDPHEAFREIDRVLDAAARHKRPVLSGIAARHGRRRAGQAASVSAGRSRRAIPKRWPKPSKKRCAGSPAAKRP